MRSVERLNPVRTETSCSVKHWHVDSMAGIADLLGWSWSSGYSYTGKKCAWGDIAWRQKLKSINSNYYCLWRAITVELALPGDLLVRQCEKKKSPLIRPTWGSKGASWLSNKLPWHCSLIHLKNSKRWSSTILVEMRTKLIFKETYWLSLKQPYLSFISYSIQIWFTSFCSADFFDGRLEVFPPIWFAFTKIFTSCAIFGCCFFCWIAFFKRIALPIFFKSSINLEVIADV